MDTQRDTHAARRAALAAADALRVLSSASGLQTSAAKKLGSKSRDVDNNADSLRKRATDRQMATTVLEHIARVVSRHHGQTVRLDHGVGPGGEGSLTEADAQAYTISASHVYRHARPVSATQSITGTLSAENALSTLRRGHTGEESVENGHNPTLNLTSRACLQLAARSLCETEMRTSACNPTVRQMHEMDKEQLEVGEKHRMSSEGYDTNAVQKLVAAARRNVLVRPMDDDLRRDVNTKVIHDMGTRMKIATDGYAPQEAMRAIIGRLLSPYATSPTNFVNAPKSILAATKEAAKYNDQPPKFEYINVPDTEERAECAECTRRDAESARLVTTSAPLPPKAPELKRPVMVSRAVNTDPQLPPKLPEFNKQEPKPPKINTEYHCKQCNKKMSEADKENRAKGYHNPDHTVVPNGVGFSDPSDASSNSIETARKRGGRGKVSNSLSRQEERKRNTRRMVESDESSLDEVANSDSSDDNDIMADIKDEKRRGRNGSNNSNNRKRRMESDDHDSNVILPKLTKDDNDTKFASGRLRKPLDPNSTSSFITGSEKMQLDNATKNNGGSSAPKKALGSSGRRSFVPPMKKTNSNGNNNNNNNGNSGSGNSSKDSNEEEIPNVPNELAQTIANEIIHTKTNVAWDDIVGLENAKKSIMEIVVWPMLRPDLFKGIRGPCKGLLLFGPPGTGKTLIGKCIASQSNATFFSISSSSLTSKWIGEGEKLVRALFAMASAKQPSVIFIDEIDSLLTQRTEGEVEATRRIKTEFLVQFDGCGTSADDRVLVIGATNRPQELDEAARRRFRKKLYIPLPSAPSRKKIIENLLSDQPHSLTDEDFEEIVKLTDGYSGSDMDGLIREAALGPLREITDIHGISLTDVRGVNISDFRLALRQVRKSVGEQELRSYEKFVDEFGSSGL